ncbi:hypothetical protein [Humitalea rosea]|nr:hypothetical protein [Humitalea rosea]
MKVALETILSGPTEALGFDAFLVACADRFGDVAVAAAIPRLWEKQAGREAILAYLHRSHRYDEYLFRARAWLVESGTTNGPLIRQIANDHLTMGAGRAFLRLLDRMPGLRPHLGGTHTRLLLAQGREAEIALTADEAYAAGAEDQLFALGWQDFKSGRLAEAAIIRQRIEALWAVRTRRLLKEHDIAAQAARWEAAPLHDILPFTFPGAADPALAAAVADMALATLRAVPAAPPPPEGLPPLTVNYLGRNGAEARQALHARGINPLALLACAEDHEWVETAAATQTAREATAWALPRLSDETFFYGYWGMRSLSAGRAVNWLRGFSAHRGLRAICPWSLRPVLATESHWFEASAHYRFEGEHVFWISNFGHQFLRGLFWTDDQAVVVGLAPQRGMDQARPLLRRFAEHLKREAPAVAAYRSGPRRIAILSGVHRNIGHNYMNEVSGLHRLRSSSLMPAGALYIRGAYDYYDALGLFGLAKDPINGGNDAELTRRVLRDGLLLIWPTDEAAYRGASQTILDAAEKAPASPRLIAALSALEGADIVIILGLRTKRRAWLSQIAGFCELLSHIERLCTEEWQARVAVIFEGYTGTIDGNPQEEAAIAHEAGLVDALRARADFDFTGPVAVSIGMTLLEKARLFRHADIAVMPKGNGHLPTLAWVTNTPTVIHSNSADLAGVLVEIALFDDGVPPVMLDRAQSIDTLVPVMTSSATRLPIAQMQSESYDIVPDRLCLEVERMIRQRLRAKRGR